MTPTPPATSASTPIPQGLVQEIEDFRSLCAGRFRFNSRMDIALNLLAIAVSLLVSPPASTNGASLPRYSED